MSFLLISSNGIISYLNYLILSELNKFILSISYLLNKTLLSPNKFELNFCLENKPPTFSLAPNKVEFYVPNKLEVFYSSENRPPTFSLASNNVEFYVPNKLEVFSCSEKKGFSNKF